MAVDDSSSSHPFGWCWRKWIAVSFFVFTAKTGCEQNHDSVERTGTALESIDLGVVMGETTRNRQDNEVVRNASRRNFLGFALGSATFSAASVLGASAAEAQKGRDHPIDSPGQTSFTGLKPAHGDTFGVLIRLDVLDTNDEDSTQKDMLFWLPIEIEGPEEKRTYKVIGANQSSPIFPRRLKKAELQKATEPTISLEDTFAALDKIPPLVRVKQALAGYLIHEGVEVRSGKILPIVEWGEVYDHSP
jgi:hypothetical protein